MDLISVSSYVFRLQSISSEALFLHWRRLCNESSVLTSFEISCDVTYIVFFRRGKRSAEIYFFWVMTRVFVFAGLSQGVSQK